MSSGGCYPDEAPRVNAVLDVLAHHLRREVIHYFETATRTATVSFDALVAHIADRVPDRDREELTTALFHVHLPKLAAEDWLAFDQQTGEIRYHGNDRALRLLQEVTDVFTK